MTTHDLLAEPAKCAECRACHLETERVKTCESCTGNHTAAQDAALVQAVRAAAGSENVVAWMLSNADIRNDWSNSWQGIARELDKIVNPAGGKP